MASEKVPAEYLKAGEDYLGALQTLGLHPEFLGWGRDLASGQLMLTMVTSVIEIGGPLALNKLLFRAYNMEVTPKEISPFIVRIFGSRTLVAPILVQLGQVRQSDNMTAQKIDKLTKRPVGEPIKIESIGQDIAGMHFESRDCYIVPKRKQRYEERAREWNRFKHNVEKLAA